MNSDRVKTIEITGRKFQIHKFDAKTSVKISKLLIAKILPAINSFLPGITGNNKADANTVLASKKSKGHENIENAETFSEMLSAISLEEVAHALDLIGEDDLDRIMDVSLRHCCEQLPAGPTPVLNDNGTFGVAGVEHDMLLMLRLITEAILWSCSGFFDASRWTLIFKPLAASFPQKAQM